MRNVDFKYPEKSDLNLELYFSDFMKLLIGCTVIITLKSSKNVIECNYAVLSYYCWLLWSTLTNLIRMFYFYTPEERQKTRDFLIFQEV